MLFAMQIFFLKNLGSRRWIWQLQYKSKKYNNDNYYKTGS